MRKSQQITSLFILNFPGNSVKLILPNAQNIPIRSIITHCAVVLRNHLYKPSGSGWKPEPDSILPRSKTVMRVQAIDD